MSTEEQKRAERWLQSFKKLLQGYGIDETKVSLCWAEELWQIEFESLLPVTGEARTVFYFEFEHRFIEDKKSVFVEVSDTLYSKNLLLIDKDVATFTEGFTILENILSTLF